MAGFTLGRAAAVDMATGFASNATLRDLELICCNAPNIPLVLEGLHDHSTLRTLILDRLANLTGIDTLLQQQRNHAISDLHISRYTADGHVLPGLEKLVTAMQRNTTVAKLTISQSSIGRDQAKELRAMFPRNQTLKSLNLVGNVMNSEGLAELATGLYRNTSLEHLDVADNQLHDAAAARILRDLMRRNKSLTRMDIDRNSIGAANVGSIANGLKTNVALQDVDLSGSMLGDAGIEVLVRGLRQNSTLQTLALCDNGITATGVHELVDLLIGSTDGVTDLVLNCNPIGYEGVNMLANALGQNVIGQLRRLYLDACTLGDDCLAVLASAIERNDSLTLLSMEDNEFGTRGLLALARSLPEMKALQRIDFTWNASVASTMTSFLEGFRENTSLLHVNIPGFEPGEWMVTIKFLSARNHFFPLLLAKDGELPLGIWSHALATAAADPDVLLYNLCAKPGLVRGAVRTLKRAAGRLDHAVSDVNQAAGDSKKQKHGQVE
jgi:Ran GTPase-activating protein (RanGAP) involved in mRNA processing and transport